MSCLGIPSREDWKSTAPSKEGTHKIRDRQTRPTALGRIQSIVIQKSDWFEE
jgi:hypothetical protein